MCSLLLKLFFTITVVEVSTEMLPPALQKAVVNDVTTSFDISTQLVTVQYSISLVSQENYLDSFVFIIDPLLVDNLAYVSAKGKNVDSRIPVINQGNGHWMVAFVNPVSKLHEDKIEIYVLFTHALKPYPERITQYERHLVVYSGPISLISPYLCLNQTIHVKLGTGKVESISKSGSDFKVKNTSLTFVSKSPIQANSKLFAKIHYEHKFPFLTVRELHRTIEISHWGNIKVEEEILLENSGAKLYGAYNRRANTTTNTIEYVTSILPASATDIVVYDEIGLIWSVTIREKFDCVEMELHPRFPLLGGWKIKYTISYNVPSYEYLFHDYDEYVLKMRVVDHIFDNMVIDKALVKVILPEGSKNIFLKTPYPVMRHNDSYSFAYLDTIGKPMMVFSKTNLVEEHMQYFVLNYNFHKFDLLLKPFYIIMFIELVFIVLIIFLRTDFRISFDEEKIEEKPNSEPLTATLVKASTAVKKQKKKKH